MCTEVPNFSRRAWTARAGVNQKWRHHSPLAWFIQRFGACQAPLKCWSSAKKSVRIACPQCYSKMATVNAMAVRGINNLLQVDETNDGNKDCLLIALCAIHRICCSVNRLFFNSWLCWARVSFIYFEGSNAITICYSNVFFAKTGGNGVGVCLTKLQKLCVKPSYTSSWTTDMVVIWESVWEWRWALVQRVMLDFCLHLLFIYNLNRNGSS